MVRVAEAFARLLAREAFAAERRRGATIGPALVWLAAAALLAAILAAMVAGSWR